jgi:Bacteriocin-protection, YdeI or OmpD-Associated/TfoX C-terminal domain
LVHKKLTEQWIGIHKKIGKENLYSANDISDWALCFGWTAVVVKSVDYYTYKMLYRKRKEKSTWSQKTIKRFLELKKQKLIQPQGQWAFDHRDLKKSEQKKYELTAIQLQKFKKNKKAWLFFDSQTAGYKKYMIQWVASAVQQKTQDQRFLELLKDSENQTKLLRVVKAQNKVIENKKNKYPKGQTPIEEAKNLGPATGSEFRSIGIETVEKLKSVGWEKAMSMWIGHYPHRIHLVAAYAVIGAVNDQSFRNLDPELKAEAKNFIKEFKSEFR